MGDDNYSLSSRVFRILRENILSGKYAPDEELKEKTIGEELGVSRTPIREAIRMLEQEGLAVTIPRKGAEVAKMTEKDMEDVLQVREALDELAASIACEEMTEEQLDELKTTMREFEEFTKTGNVKKIAEADVKFHDIIYHATGNPKLVNILNNLREQMYRYRVEYLKEEQTRNLLVSEHEELVKAIREGDVQKAQDISFHHLENQRMAIIRTIRAENAARESEKKE